MKKGVLFFLSLLVLSVFSYSLVLADSDNGNSDDQEDDFDENDGSDKDDLDDLDENETDDDLNDDNDKLNSSDDDSEDDSDDGNRSKVRKEIRAEIREKDGVNITKVRIKERNGESEIETKIIIKESIEGNITKIKVKLSNGSEIEMKIFPKEASELARQRLESSNFSIDLREVNNSRNIPRVVYHIESNKTGKFLGIFKMKVKMEGNIDSETGEVDVNVPWWIFLVSQDKEEVPVRNETESNESLVNNSN